MKDGSRRSMDNCDMSTKLVGRYIVTDPRVCRGAPTFRGTRILVADVLEQVASGMAWGCIVEEWRGSINEEAIAEAVRVRRKCFEYTPVN